MLKYNSFESQYKTPFGAITLKKNIIIRVKAVNVENVFINLYKDEIKSRHKMTRLNEEFFSYHFQSPSSEGLIQYNFETEGNEGRKMYGPMQLCNGEAVEIHDENRRYQLTVYQANDTPDWFKEGNMYQIYVDRFFNGNENNEIRNMKKNCLIHSDWDDRPVYVRDNENIIISWDFFGGNLKGITRKLPYLSELGITIIYLNPIFESSSNHKYDTGDYSRIDGMYGDEDDFRELIDTAGKSGINIILDGVFSHTGSDSIYFNKEGNYDSIGAYQSKASDYFEWFNFKEHPDSYDCWWDIESMPNINEMNKSFLTYLFDKKHGIVRKWMRMGIRGFRLDVADELPDEFIRLLKQAVREEDKESILLGEVWEDASNKISYHERRKYILGNRLDSVTDYPLRNNVIKLLNGEMDCEQFVFENTALMENYPKEVYFSLMNMTGTHDTIRLINLFAGCQTTDSIDTFKKRNFVIKAVKMDEAIIKVILYSTIIFSLPGVPCIYYGDEAGAEGYEDPYNRGTFPWGKENQTLLYNFKKLANLRKNEAPLNKGEIDYLMKDRNVLSVKRTSEHKTIVTYVNLNSHEISLSSLNDMKDFRILFSTYLIEGETDDIMIPSYGALIISDK